MSVESRPTAQRGPARPARLHRPGTVTTADRLLPGHCRLTLQIDETPYHVRPLPCDPEIATAAYRLVPKVSGTGPAIACAEWADTDAGLQVDGWLGLACDCRESSDSPCRHLRALVACGLLRPHPTWGEEDVVDPVLATCVEG